MATPKRRGNTYHFRAYVPADLAPKLGCEEVARSLRTTNYRTARRLDASKLRKVALISAPSEQMPLIPADIDKWRQAKSENEHLEFKAAKNSFDFKDLTYYCTAIANEGGGKLLLGIADKPPRPVVGTNAYQNPQKVAEDLFNKLDFRVDVEQVAHPDGRVLVFHIPSRPRGTAYQVDGRYLMRSGESLVSMTEDQLRKIFGEGRPDWLEESTIGGLSDEAVIELLDTQTFFELLKLPYPSTQQAVIAKLLEERLVDTHGEGITIRRIGAILLAKKLTDFPEVSRKAPRVVVYTGTSKLETKLDQTGTKGYAVGFQGLVKFVMSQLPQNEIIEDALRREIKLVPEVVVRELVANAIIHQDFMESGASMMVEIYADRVEISNPGEPVVPVDRFIDGYRSRNERLADLMRRMGICEEKSSGIDRVVQAVEMLQLPAPDFRVGHRRTIVTIYGPIPFDEMSKNDRVRACYQHCVLRYVTNDRMTNQSLRERFRLSDTKAAVASQIIAATLEAGFVKADEAVGGSKKYARYLPAWA